MAPRKRQYAKEDFEKALKYIKEENGSVRNASKRFGIPRTSLQYKLQKPDSRYTSGPTPFLTSAEEEALTDFIIQLAKQGFPRNKEDIQNCVQQFLKENPRPTPFKNGRPGEGWFQAFLKRHPNITFRTSEGVSNAGACVSEQDIRKWFKQIHEFIELKGLEDVIRDPRRIFNADETGFYICPKTGKVLAEKGTKNVPQVEKGSSKENLTVMFTFSADGSTYHPMIIYPYTRIPDRVGLSVPPGWGIGRSEKGWMTSSVFKDFIENCFYPQLVKNDVPLPVILFVDGHKTHVTIEVVEVCRNLEIHLIALYPNATHILQPADVAAFQPIKAGWKRGLRKWHSANKYAVNLTRETFAPLLKDVLETTAKKETLINGFRACGFYPFNADNVNYTKCLADTEKSNDDIPGAERNGGLNYVDYVGFCDIVGQSVIEECQKARWSEVKNNDIYFQAIYKLWKKFIDTEEMENDDNEKLNALKTILSDEKLVVDIDSVEYKSTHGADDEQGEILDEVTGEIIKLNKNESKVEISTSEKKKIDEPRIEPSNGNKITIENGMADVDYAEYQRHVSLDLDKEQSKLLEEVTGEIIELRNNKRISDIHTLEEDKISPHEEPRTEPSDVNVNENVLKETKSVLPQVQELRSQIQVISNISMAEFLNTQKPIRPKRKGKHQTERLPFALTSDSYVEIVKAKHLKKKEEEDAKENRKRVREEKKKQKDATIAIKKLKKISADEEKKKTKLPQRQRQPDKVKCETYIPVCCDACLSPIIKRLIKCSQCNKKFHLTCVPENHRMHIPDDADDEYLCHICYRVSNKDSSEGDIDELYTSMLEAKSLGF